MGRLNMDWRRGLVVFLAAAMFSGISGCNSAGSEELLAPPTDTGEDDLGTPPEILEPLEGSPRGFWSEVFDWPLVPIHMVLLPDDRVLTYGSTGGTTGGLQYDLWTPAFGFEAEAHQTLQNFTATDIFCSAQLVLPQPRAGVLIAGGDTFPRREVPVPDDGQEIAEDNDDGNQDSTILDFANDDSLQNGATMNRGRWYGTATTLVDGRVLIQGGRSFSRVSGEDRPEIRGQDGIFRLLNGVDTSNLRFYYPRNFVQADGSVFGFDTAGRMYRMTTEGQGSLTILGRLNRFLRGDDSTAAMFRPGRILQFGGNAVENSLVAAAAVIDVSRGDPVVTRTGDMSELRRLSSATILPDGSVLATGGSQIYNELRGVSFSAEIWDPITGRWTEQAEAANDRLYHSSALLLRDGSVLVGGGGLPGPSTHLNVEVYYPPYLFDRSSGDRLRQPTINAPESVSVGRHFSLTFRDFDPAESVDPAVNGTARIRRVTMLKTGSNTHNWNMEQRFIELPFEVVNQTTVDVRMPSQAGEVTPGYYLVFAHNVDGVPSLGQFVFVNTAPLPEPQEDPTIVRPLDQTDIRGFNASLSLSGTEPNGQPLSFAAAGLPPGIELIIDELGSARLEGIPTRVGTFDVVVNASDGTRTASANFIWVIEPPNP